ncbi:CHAP domain-containing protein [Dictyobacter kobayashii]|uniref:Peptidase C51 domain-containing protein n=1 Tax=Dictyobacter kobayashii TaxID=2014872 RepID=A0A402ANN0_9CHLR|nr:CHAP domain-containing protein [Dictyobacter kobayashii]GCE20634.1 hypothetical protein KDK_44340 [Dictyobacter kobayashii]
MLFGDRNRKVATDVQYGAVPAKGEDADLLVEQLPFPDTDAAMAVPTRTAPAPASTALNSSMMPGSTQNKLTTTSVRMPVVIPGNGKKSSGKMRPPQGRSMVVHAGVALVLIVVVAGALMAVLPTGSSQAFKLGMPFDPSTSEVTSKQNNTALIAAQAATATAVTQDGFDPGNVTYAGVKQTQAPVQAPPPVPTQAPAPAPVQAQVPAPAPVTNVAGNADSSARFFVGQCTYWANIHYHGLTGWWVEWLGNADAWAGGAASNGWITSAEPNPNGPSIIVLQPGVEGAGGYGHVGVVESGVSAASANANGVSVSNMNWNGGWDQVSYWTFHPGAGVTFIWHP